jgi:hypothetical protein
MTKLQKLTAIKKNLENRYFNKKFQFTKNRLFKINEQIFELQSGLNLEPIRELQQFSSNNSTLESIRDELLITLNDSDINQFLKTFA